MGNTLTPEKIAWMEEKLRELGRTVECIDPRKRPGHPPDWKICFADGTETMTCGDNYESVLAYAVLAKEPADWQAST